MAAKRDSEALVELFYAGMVGHCGPFIEHLGCTKHFAETGAADGLNTFTEVKITICNFHF